MGLARDISKVMGSNIIVLLSGVINGFILPAILSIDDYANLKTYSLYIQYIGLLHFGFVDGIYIKYGGKSIKNIQIEKLNLFHLFFLSFQIIITIILSVYSYINNNTILLLFAISIIPVNLQNFFTYLYQAFGNFNTYSIAKATTPFLIVLANLILVFIVKSTSYIPYVIVTILGYSIVTFVLDFMYLKKYISFNFTIEFSEIKKIFHSGIFILMGNIAFVFFFAIGRWIVKIFMENKEFAIFSFAATMMALITVFINSVTHVFFPHFAKNNDQEKIRKYRRILLMVSSLSPIGFYAARFFVSFFIPKYSESIILMGVLVASVPAMTIIKAIYMNIYKVQKKEKKYLFDSLIFVLIAIIINLSVYFLYKTLISVAFATIISINFWWINPPKKMHKGLAIDIKEILFVFLWSSFYLVTIFIEPILGVVVGIFGIVLLNLTFFMPEIKGIISSILERTNKKNNE